MVKSSDLKNCFDVQHNSQLPNNGMSIALVSPTFTRLIVRIMKPLKKATMKDVAVIDIEASGFGAESYPIEIGIVLPDGTRYQSLVKPEPTWLHWDKDAQDIHGISRLLLLKEGRPVQEICRDINAICNGVTLYSDCWVHDAQWFNALFTAARMPALACCRAIEYLLDDQQQARYQHTKPHVAKRLGLTLHRALNDAIAIQNTLRELRFIGEDQPFVHQGRFTMAG
ncbi:3'-5' exoribonuclease [Saccharophagus sp. K07]|uniref:3'-5' exonuclease n=1 Tax=Saccharophagus sp. K07 TaxID=2283636 RepID=UPI001652015B|nr:3'-5' exoribonuclease [Saccharophagus sp. K07]